jgi:hypothetical protein
LLVGCGVGSEMKTRRLDEILMLAREDFNEMPGLTMSVAEAQRSWGLEAHLCLAILESLEETGFLRRTRDGAFVRYSDSPEH